MLTRFNEGNLNQLIKYKTDFFRQMTGDYTTRIRPGLEMPGTRYVCYYEPCNSILVSHSRSNRIHIINLDTGEMRFHDYHSKTVRKILMHNNEIITAGWDGTVRVVNFNTLIQRMILTNEHMGRSPHVTVSDSGNHIISFSYDSDIRPECRANSVKVWNMKNGRLKWVINNTGEHRSLRRSGACLTHNDLLYVISDSGYLSVFEVKSNTLIKRVFLSLNLRTMCIHEGRNLVFAGDDSGTVFICRLGSIDLLRTLICHCGEISEIRIHETNNDIVITTGFDGAIKFWELPCFSCVGVITGNLGRLWTHAMRKDILFAGSDEGEIYVFDIQDMGNCRLKGTLEVYNNFYLVKPVDSTIFYTNNITYFDLLDKNSGVPVPRKKAEYLLSSCNRESVLHEVFKTSDEIKEFSNPSLQMNLQLPSSF